MKLFNHLTDTKGFGSSLSELGTGSNFILKDAPTRYSGALMIPELEMWQREERVQGQPVLHDIQSSHRPTCHHN